MNTYMHTYVYINMYMYLHIKVRAACVVRCERVAEQLKGKGTA